VGFHIDATRLCTPPPDYDPFERPLVEYFIHGRGNGHYARSMAVIESLNDVGIDVRMFIGRAPIWNFFHSAKPLLGGKKGQTTAIAVTSLQPMPVFPTISHVMERIMGDCEVALQTNRYPLLVISDGDAPGMLRAYYGSIPSLAISHGQIFSIGIKPDWVLEDKRLNEAWDKQGRLNRNAALFSRWQIGTDFGYLEPKQPSAIVARPPFRPEVLKMAVARKHVVDGSQLIVEEHEIAQRMANLVLHGNEFVDDKDTYNARITSSHRKLVLCYFRDHNGEIIIDALLQAGFDVLFFETSYNKKFGTDDPNRFGTKWIVKEEDRVKLREAAQFGGATPESHKKDHHKKEPHRRLSERWRRDSASARLIRVTDRALFVPFMSIADGIVASAGSQLISECIYANIPLLALYRMDDDEQVLNVEMSRQERVMRRKIPVYGASFENFHAAYPTKYSYVRRSKHAATPAKLQSSGANVARSEFESFVDKVDESIVSDAYFQFLKNPGNVTTMLHNEVQNIPSSDRADDPFHGMPDAAAIILEVIKQVQKEADEG
jgi:hypothetical protein